MGVTSLKNGPREWGQTDRKVAGAEEREGPDLPGRPSWKDLLMLGSGV